MGALITMKPMISVNFSALFGIFRGNSEKYTNFPENSERCHVGNQALVAREHATDQRP